MGLRQRRGCARVRGRRRVVSGARAEAAVLSGRARGRSQGLPSSPPTKCPAQPTTAHDCPRRRVGCGRVGGGTGCRDLGLLLVHVSPRLVFWGRAHLFPPGLGLARPPAVAWGPLSASLASSHPWSPAGTSSMSTSCPRRTLRTRPTKTWTWRASPSTRLVGLGLWVAATWGCWPGPDSPATAHASRGGVEAGHPCDGSPGDTGLCAQWGWRQVRPHVPGVGGFGLWSGSLAGVWPVDPLRLLGRDEAGPRAVPGARLRLHQAPAVCWGPEAGCAAHPLVCLAEDTGF